MKVAAVVVIIATVTGCGVFAPPLEGPGYEGEVLVSEAPGPFIVSTTQLILKSGDSEAQALFDKNMEAINAALPQQPGLVGFSLGIEPFASGYRTLSVWESEDAVLGWVVSDAHAAAMGEMADHSDPASAVLSWSVTREELIAAPPSFNDAAARLDAEGRQVY
jgi:heme-degrading monooxygenase HmoA